MPTSLSLQDLNLRKVQVLSSQTSSEHGQQFFGDSADDAIELANDVIDEGGAIKDGAEMQMQQFALNVGVPEAESEHIVIESVIDDVVQDNDQEEQQWRAQKPQTQIEKNEQPMEEQGLDVEQSTNVDRNDTEEAAMGRESLSDFPVFKASPMSVFQFSSEFLAIVRKHRLQPKARAILLDLMERTMPEDNRCPQTIPEMRKLVADDERTQNGWFLSNSLHSFQPSCSSKSVPQPQSIRPQSHYLLPYIERQSTSTSRLASIKSSPRAIVEPRRYTPTPAESDQPCSSTQGCIQTTVENEEYYLSDEYAAEEVVEDSSGIFYYPEEEYPADTHHRLLPQIIQTINRLSNEVAFLRTQMQTQKSYGTLRKAIRRRSAYTDGRVGLHVYDAQDNKMLLGDLSADELRSTIDLSRHDESSLIYGQSDITEMVLEKIDLAPYIHNPSLCGRMVADVLFSPEYLADKHILAEGQVSSRARLEILPPEMTRLFYDSLRKLGVSRVCEEDQEHWLYLARDGVNQRARDLKANRKRKFYIDEQPPVFNEEHIEE